MSNKITFQEETMSDIIDELVPLFDEHYNEVGAFGGLKVGLDIQWTVYKNIEEQGMLHFVTARKDKKLVGYYVSIIVPHLHFANTLVAENDTLFLRKDHRKGLTGCKLIKYASKLLREKCEVVLLNLPVGAPYIKVANRSGFKLIGHKFRLEET